MTSGNPDIPDLGPEADERIRREMAAQFGKWPMVSRLDRAGALAVWARLLATARAPGTPPAKEKIGARYIEGLFRKLDPEATDRGALAAARAEILLRCVLRTPREPE